MMALRWRIAASILLLAASIAGGLATTGPADAATEAIARGDLARDHIARDDAAKGDVAAEDALLPVDAAFALTHAAQADGSVQLHWRIAPGYYLYRHRTAVRTPQGHLRLPQGQPYEDPYFGPVQTYRTALQAHWKPASPSAAEELQVEYQGCADAGVCYPPQRRTLALAPALALTQAPPSPGAPAAAHTGLAWALLLALFGGLVLNLMPCVLPVLSLKVIGLAGSGGSPQRARQHALAYTAGVLTTFALLGGGVVALRALGHGIGWGAQLQHPVIVAGLAYLMIALGLGMSGVYTPGGRLAGMGQALASRPGHWGDFFTGVLACVVASPCVAPFMGTALAYAFVAPPLQALLVFLALGLGLALPFLLIGFVPALARLLPAPGAWMETLKQALAFPLYVAAAWLLWVLGRQRGVDALVLVLIGAVVLAAGLWWYERARWRSRHLATALALGLGALGLAPLLLLPRIAPPTATATAHASTGTHADATAGSAETRHEAFSDARLAQLRSEGRTVFVNMTADWCVTCKANEHTVLATRQFQQQLQDANGAELRGDWTNGDPQISRFLDAHGAVGVPLYVVFHPGQPPRVLGGLLDQRQLARALTP